jgi:5-methyltetrahydropteroyltriglutamate--homocysteine methyltransferase
VHADESYTDDVVRSWSDDPAHEPLFARATREAIEVQIAAGIDIPTDGEQRRENYVHYQCRYMQGFDFKTLERRVLRNGAYESDLPAVRSQIIAGKPVLPRDYKQAQGFTDRPVKITMPGPMTIIGTVADCFYNDDKQLAFDLAGALNQEVRALADAGCIHIQIDEPLFARKPDDAAAFGYEALERAFHGVPDHVVRTSHMCCGYPEHIDQPEYPKADHNVYHQLVEALDGKIDALSIEDCHCHSDLSLFEKFTKTIAIVGFVDIAVSEIEQVEQIAARMREVLTVLPPERLMAAPDCGLGFLTLEQTRTKLTNMCKAAAMV